MESVLAAAITGVLTLIGVLVSNTRSKAVLELKIDTLSERVQKHNELISRTYQLESDMAVTRNDIETLYRKVDGR
jgi:outer membrane murein-binding lipoprotein Lpp